MTGLPYVVRTAAACGIMRKDFTFVPPAATEKRTGLWRFHKSIDLPEGAAQISLGEGATPLIWSDYDRIPVGFDT
jgi:hypothetical protein